jgi:hypothetical protein
MGSGAALRKSVGCDHSAVDIRTLGFYDLSSWRREIYAARFKLGHYEKLTLPPIGDPVYTQILPQIGYGASEKRRENATSPAYLATPVDPKLLGAAATDASKTNRNVSNATSQINPSSLLATPAYPDSSVDRATGLLIYLGAASDLLPIVEGDDSAPFAWRAFSSRKFFSQASPVAISSCTRGSEWIGAQSGS